jgi:hypothetical protein
VISINYIIYRDIWNININKNNFFSIGFYNDITNYDNIKNRKINKKDPANEIKQEDITLFLSTIQQSKEYTKVRDLQKILRGNLNSIKVNTIFKYLVRSKIIEVDLDGNIIWIKKTENNQTRFWERASISKDFRKLLLDKNEISRNEFDS